MWLTKEKIWQLSNELGGSDFIEIIINDTHSCYRGERRRKWEWGYGCNDCPACELRMQGFVKFKKVYKR